MVGFPLGKKRMNRQKVGHAQEKMSSPVRLKNKVLNGEN